MYTNICKSYGASATAELIVLNPSISLCDAASETKASKADYDRIDAVRPYIDNTRKTRASLCNKAISV